MNYRCSSRRGVASIIGGVFLVMIIVSGFAFFLISNKATNNLDNVMRKMAALDADMNKEGISVLSVLPLEGLEKGIVLTVANIGSEILTIKYLGEINENVAYDQYSFIELQKVVGVDPDIRIGSYNVYKIPINDFDKDGKYVIKLITGKGNIFTISYPYYGITPTTSILRVRSIGADEVTVEGYGFDINHEITITWDGEYPSTATTDGSGSFTVEIDVQDLTEGWYLVMAHDGSNIALEYFYVEK